LTTPSDLTISLESGADTTALIYRCAADATCARATLVIAHGAGAGQRSAFMVDFATALSGIGVDVVTFNFPYTERRRKIPDRAPVLEACYREVIAAARRELESARRALFAGGKSMGGRIATQVAAADPDLPIAGLVLLGYPLHPPGKPLQRRDKHLPAVRRPMLFLQGTRDAFGTPEELAPVLQTVQPPATLHPVPQGDHSFKLTRKDPAAQAAAYLAIQKTIAAWIRAQAP
jgi:predicted alpha/beta-hydrolase family hydrolase